MRKFNIVEFFELIGFDPAPYLDRIKAIGDLTAIRTYKDKTYRKNYERGLLLIALAKHFNSTKFLEFGTGRGYAVGCLAAFTDIKLLTTIDKTDHGIIGRLKEAAVDVSRIHEIRANANNLNPMDIKQLYDLVFIDARHDKRSARLNHRLTTMSCIRDHVVVFDDYSKKFDGVQKAVDEIECNQKFLVHTNGWLIENECINDAGGTDSVQDGKEHGSGMVVCLYGKLALKDEA